MAAYIDFKALAEAVDVEAVASRLGLKLKRSAKELRGQCPACDTDDERALAIMPETNSFRCYAAQLSGDCISLYAHIKGVGNYKAAKDLQEQFKAPANAGPKNTPPQKPEARKVKSEPGPFDPEAYASKLQYTPEIEELGISETDAERLGIGFASTGFHRGSIVFAIRNPDGSIAGFAGYKDGQLKFPQKWLTSNVVRLKRA